MKPQKEPYAISKSETFLEAVRFIQIRLDKPAGVAIVTERGLASACGVAVDSGAGL